MRNKIINMYAVLCACAILCSGGYAEAKDADSRGCCVIYTDVNGLETTGGAARVAKRAVRLRSAASESDLDFVEQSPTVDLVFCCDSAAMAVLNNQRKTIETFARETVDRMNMILGKNEIDGHFTFRSVGCAPMKSRFQTVVDGLGIKRGRGDNGIALALKEATGADIIVCVNSGGGGAIGVAYGVTEVDQERIAQWGRNAGNPIASVNVSAAIGGYVTSHEVGHVMGAGHSREEAGPQSTPYSAGLHIEITNRLDGTSVPFTNYYYTVMAYNGTTGSDGQKHVYTAIPYYSDSTKTFTPDPDVFDPVPIGDAERNDNARVLRDNCKSVASWREHVLPYEGDVRAYDANGEEILHGRAFASSLQISFVSPVEGARILYTLDGTTPKSTSAEYSGPFTVSDTTTIAACALKDGRAYGLRTFKVMKLGMSPVAGPSDIVWQTDPTSPWWFDGTALRSAYAAHSWLRAKMTGPKRMTFYYAATIGNDAQFDVWVNGISKLRVTESTTGFPSATVDLPEGENDVIFFYRHGGYYEDNKVYVQIASVENIASDEAAIPVAKPVAVWNGDFNLNVTRGPVTFNSNNNIVAADGSKVSRVEGKGAIAFNVSAGPSVLAVAGTTDFATGTANGEGTPKAVIAIPTTGQTSLDAGFGTKTLNNEIMRFKNAASVADYSVRFPREGFHTFAFGATASGSLCYFDGKEVFDDGSYGLSGNVQAVYVGAGGGGSFPTVAGDLNYIAIFTNATVSANDARNWSLKNMTVPLTLSAGGDLGEAALDASTGLNLSGGAYVLSKHATVAALIVQGNSSIDFATLDAVLGGGQVIYVADGRALVVTVSIGADELKREIDAAGGEWRHLLIKGANYGDVTAGGITDLGARYSLHVEQTETGGVELVGERRDVVYADGTVGGESGGDVLGATNGNVTVDYHYGNVGVTVYETGAVAGAIIGGFRLDRPGSKVVNGNTSVTLQSSGDASGTFSGNIIGASLGGGCDCETGEAQALSVIGSSSVSINAPLAMTFSGTICGGGYLRLPISPAVGLGMYGQAATNTVGTASSVTILGGTYTGTVVAGGHKEDDENWSLYFANALVTGTATLTIEGGVFNGATLLGGDAIGTKALAFTGRTDLLGETAISGFGSITIAEGVFVKVESATTLASFPAGSFKHVTRGGVTFVTNLATSNEAEPTALVQFVVPSGTAETVPFGETISASSFIVNGTLTVAGAIEGETIGGTGEVVFKGKTPDALGWTSGGWTGTVVLSGVRNLNDFNPSRYGKVKFSGSSGNFADGTFSTEAVFEDGTYGYAFNLTGPEHHAQFGKVSGNGTIIDSGTDESEWSFKDATTFSGSIKSDGGNTTFVFRPNTSATRLEWLVSPGTITVQPDGHAVVGVDREWNPANSIIVMERGVVELLGAAKFAKATTLENGSKIIFDDFTSASYGSDDAVLSCPGGVSGASGIGFGADVASLAADTCLIAWPTTSSPPTFTPDAAANALAANCQVRFSTEPDGLYLRAREFRNDAGGDAGYYAISSEYGRTYVVVTNASGSVTISNDVGWAEFWDLKNEMSLTVEFATTDDLEFRLKNCAWYARYMKDGVEHTIDVKSAYCVNSRIQSGRTVFTLSLTGYNEAGEEATVNVDGVAVKVIPELDPNGELEISDAPTMTVRTIPGFWYEIVTTDDLSRAFTPIEGTRTQATSASTTLSAPSAQPGTNRFFRVKVEW